MRVFIGGMLLLAALPARAQRKDTVKQEALREVIIQGAAPAPKPIATATQEDIKGVQLFQTRGNSLGESLKSIPGLNSIQTGPSISKPVIHGLHSNRVLILNNGVRQEGQQWGSEHAPEIDPFTADHISVIEGAASIRYGSDAVAGVVLLEPKALPDTLLGGTLDLVGASNGRMGAVSAMLEGAGRHALEGLQWRVQGTLKKAGNFKTAHYFMENTGLTEGDYSGTLAYHRKQYGLSVYYSAYNTKLGIFSGSHVGNLQDLDSAFARPRPITPSYFSYKIGRSYQQIHHDLLKANGYYDFKNGGKFEVIFARQKDLRQEYDIDYPYSDDPAVLNAPQISFQIITHTADLLYHFPAMGRFNTLVGISGSTQGNVFSGQRYLVPNFRNYGGGAYAIEKYTQGKLTLEAGLRYDYRWLRVYRRDETNLYLYQNTHTYANVTATGGATYHFSERFSLNANVGTAWRAPSVNELYINGIHLSAASYEKGDSTLQSEHSINSTLSARYTGPKLFAQLNLYDNEINNYIYAKPLLQDIHIISGTYPLFQYTQQNVRLRGFDAEVDYDFLRHFTLVSKTSIVRGFNKTIHDYLIFMPADRFDNQLKYAFTGSSTWLKPYLSLQYVYVAKQTRVPPNSDYVPPPAAYGLWNTSLGSDIALGKRVLRADLTVNNLTNVAYRDYLNRFRYYTDDLGRSVVLRLSTSF
ncbi:MAG TPA: TonB-dependent receptor [Chitinophaga sp.]